MSETAGDRLTSLRRELHRHPEPAWREFRTTARLVEELERTGVDELYVGPEAIDPEARMGLPPEAEIEEWRERAREAGADPDLLERMAGGVTGAVAVLRTGEGPTVALRTDIDALPRAESESEEHLPAREGFRSETGAMHACGHDGHAAIGVGVLERVHRSDFEGTFKLVLQPAEEVVGGGRAVVEGGHFDDVDHLLATHLGLDHPTGEVVAGVGGFLAVSHFEAVYEGEPAHAGAHPAQGHNAVQAMAGAIGDLYGIARHEDGATRVNVGQVHSDNAANIVAEEATMMGEVRGETTELMEYTWDRARTVMEGAAATHDCEVTVGKSGEAPSAESDQALVDLVAGVAREAGVDSVLDRAELGGSEDATYLMSHVQERGGLATYVGVGTDHPGGHHTATFDVDERSLPIGVDVLASAVERIGRERPEREE
ncbi:amidohydrolase [Halobacteriales archaeon SW_5_70_135]|nr:MAG: amidohydrolase [Halobacteriales archaeon SW_5_70_135]